ncbi:long-chain fatty acid--CoA ligase [Haematobacter missouriensis]|uniref:Long-chain fatty acid--CoA ligase n=1 Tax=Haematobacter missouriensis TaxID=366616 RepID=A0A212ASC8_9RHOB|nr:long-chain-fatty-acid--CoA ligase [Haematobacter missouriensis]KFI29863.1 long-chain fatty acid--CoA ligase [Haematobacter missouriensis]OWJ74791.1 long-chain fatty acid--CoA ligase [Haematobacter missouriensis]OWJ84369.1 long-chain fatty acid--CoA ligase [Haematobacter missouriensis]
MSDPVRPWPAGVPERLDAPRHNVAENLRLSAERVPEAVAIIYHGTEITYAALQARVIRLAGWLQERAGVRRGDRVVLYMQNSPQFIIAFHAILRANAVAVPVNPMNRLREMEHVVADSGARVAIVGQELLDHIAPLIGRPLAHVLAAAYADMADPTCDIPLPSGLEAGERDDYPAGVTGWRAMEAAGLTPGLVTTDGDDLAAIPYTSGTTGRQKGCMHSHATLQTTLVGSVVWNPLGEGGATLSVLPLFHVTGMQNSMNGPIHAGETIVLMSRWDRRVAVELIRRYRIARWRSISTMIVDLVSDPDIRAEDLASLQTLGGGGAAMPAAVAARLKALTGLDYIEGYGMTETIAGVLINPHDAPRPQCLGIPVFDVDARIIDPDTGRELGPEEPGEIIVSAPQVFHGYWNNEEATRAAFLERDGKRFLRTGDIARYDRDGYFYIVDRVKRMVNASGFKVWPTEVEALMHAHPGIVEACIVGYPDPRRGEAVLAYVVPRGELPEADLIAWCREQMAAYKVPRRVVYVEALPRSGSGKVQWLELQERAARDFGAVSAAE